MIDTVFLALLLQAAQSTPVASDIKIVDRVETYRIEGDSTRELWDQIHLLGTIDPSQGKRVAGYTHWHIAWGYTLRSDARGCHLEDVDVSVTTVITLPEWTNAERSDATLRSKWDNFIVKLREHEAGHRQNGLLAAQAVRKVIADAGPQTDCKVLDHEVEAATNNAVTRYNRADTEYDDLTHHGVKQGAVL